MKLEAAAKFCWCASIRDTQEAWSPSAIRVEKQMASSTGRGVPCPVPLLISKVLHSGDSVKIGRKSSCEVLVKSPFISGTHCKINVTSPENTTIKKSGDLRFFVSDLSTNGTWLLKNAASRSTSGSGECLIKPGDGRSAKKLGKTKEEFSPGDCILLLAPQHKECMQYRFMVKRKGSECILEQLPATFKWNEAAIEVTKENIMDTNETETESAIVGRKRFTSSSGDEAAKKHCATSTSEDSMKKNTDLMVSSNDSEEEVEMERCPNCWKLFPIHELPLHSPICQDAVAKRRNSSTTSRHHSREVEDEAATSPHSTSRRSPAADLATTSDCLEQCPHCLDQFPLEILISHAETCSLASSSGSAHSSSGSSSGRPVSRTSVDGDEPAALPVSILRDTSMEQCPYCSELLPVTELITHCTTCGKSDTVSSLGTRTTSEAILHTSTMADVEADSVTVKRARYTLEPFDRSAVSPLPSMKGAEFSLDGLTREGASVMDGGKPRSLTDRGDELEQCVHCLNEFPISELVSHAASCLAAAKETGAENTVLEHCQHCLNVFPLSDLVAHALNCSQRKDIGSLDTDGGVLGDEEMWGEPLERCMHCFKDFPLSKMVEHSRKCRGDMLGSRERFKNFLPSVHDLDPMSLAVLNEAQTSAVEYVMEISRKESESVYTKLRDRVIGLGYTEHELEQTLQWIRRDAPIIIHLNLDRVLQFLVKDTHYRNLFETHTGSGSLDKSARSGWEDRIFNNLYRGSAPADRVKYGVLNIVGDPRGVSCCSGYGDSFLQLKKVRLRTTFASEDTSSSGVVLSCCEHYGNVLYQYNNSELKAILEVATRKVEFLRSDMIGQYKEIQIHGPVCLSENVDCIVVNDRHSADTAMRELLDVFVTKNKCNLIWMERADRIDYPSFTHAPAHIAPFVPPPLVYAAPVPALPPVPPHTRSRRRKHKRRHH